MKNPRLTVFAGAITSLAFMHVMASFFGYATTVIPRGIIISFINFDVVNQFTTFSFSVDLLHLLTAICNIWPQNVA